MRDVYEPELATKPGIQDTRSSVFVSLQCNKGFIWTGTNSKPRNPEPLEFCISFAFSTGFIWTGTNSETRNPGL